MTTTMGYFLSCEEYTPAELVEQARAAEDAGFQALWISDHFHPWNDEQGESPFVWSVIGAISQVCELPVTTAVTCPMVRTHPAIVAQAAATSALMLRGGFTLGVGTGEALNEHILGDPWPSADVRLEMLEEAVALMRRLWEGDFVTQAGPTTGSTTPASTPFPTSRPRSTSPASVPRRRMSPRGSAMGTSRPRPTPSWSDGSRTARAASRRRPARRSPTPRPSTRGSGTRTACGPTAGFPATWPRCCRLRGTSSRRRKLVTEQSTRDSVVAGPDPEAHLAQVDSYREAGYDELYVANMGPHYLHMIEFYGKEILPALG